MAATELRQRIKDRLVGEIEDTQFPSVSMLERIEQTLTTADELERYAETLVEKVESTRFPSVQLLERLDSVLDRLERLERRELEAARQ